MKVSFSKEVIEKYAKDNGISEQEAFEEIKRYSVVREDYVFLPDGSVIKYVEEFGGEGSGNFGHAGRPGEVGGSGEDISGSETGYMGGLSKEEEDDVAGLSWEEKQRYGKLRNSGENHSDIMRAITSSR